MPTDYIKTIEAAILNTAYKSLSTKYDDLCAENVELRAEIEFLKAENQRLHSAIKADFEGYLECRKAIHKMAEIAQIINDE